MVSPGAEGLVPELAPEEPVAPLLEPELLPELVLPEPELVLPEPELVLPPEPELVPEPDDVDDCTVKLIGAEVSVLPLLSVATAVSE